MIHQSERRPFGGVDHCTLQAAADRLGRHRSTVQRWLPRIRAVTGCSLRRGPRNQWWIPVTVVEQLCRDADLLDAVRRRSEGGPNGTPAGDEILTALEQLLGEVRTNRALLQQLIAARGRGEAP